MYEYENLLVTVEDRVATVTLNRPERQNTFSPEMLTDIFWAFTDLGKDPDVGAIVFTGAGKNLCAGGNIKRFKQYIDDKEPPFSIESVARAGRASKAIRYCPKPVIAMINGAAAGAGASLSLACDFRFMEPKSKIIMSFINLSLSGDTGGVFFLQRLVGTARAIDLAMTATPITSEMAKEWGLARIAEEGKLKEATYAFANKMAHGPTVGYAEFKKIINEFFFKELDTFAAWEGAGMVAGAETDDFKEAVNAFLEKRPIKYTGK